MQTPGIGAACSKPARLRLSVCLSQLFGLFADGDTAPSRNFQHDADVGNFFQQVILPARPYQPSCHSPQRSEPDEHFVAGFHASLFGGNELPKLQFGVAHQTELVHLLVGNGVIFSAVVGLDIYAHLDVCLVYQLLKARIVHVLLYEDEVPHYGLQPVMHPSVLVLLCNVLLWYEGLQASSPEELFNLLYFCSKQTNGVPVFLVVDDRFNIFLANIFHRMQLFPKCTTSSSQYLFLTASARFRGGIVCRIHYTLCVAAPLSARL